jgi:hypothetical protein
VNDVQGADHVAVIVHQQTDIESRLTSSVQSCGRRNVFTRLEEEAERIAHGITNRA